MKHCKSVTDKDDMFSKLHDELLLRIIDLLPIKDVLKTCVLSSRWRNLERSISNIDLGDFSFATKEDKSSFLELIDRLLVCHDSCDIKKFVFIDDILLPHDWSDINLFVSSKVPMDVARIHRWISEVIKRNVQELRFCLSWRPVAPRILPLCLFKSESLTVLEIDIPSIILGSSSENNLFSVHLPSLSRLKLSHIVFLDNHSTQQFFDNIPKLQQLCLYDCKWKKVNSLFINIPTLEEAHVYNRGSSYGESNRGGLVKISAPSLTSFKCETNFYMDILLSNHSSSLLNVFLEGDYPYHGDNDQALAVIRLLESVKNSISLKVTWQMSKWLRIKGISARDLPLFTNLTHLEIFTHQNSSYSEVNLKKILMFLHNIPNLQSLDITLPELDEQIPQWEFSFDWHFEEDWSNGEDDDVPSCVIHRLKKFSISSKSDIWRFGGQVKIYQVFMGLIKYFMDHSQSLKTLDVHWLYCEEDEEDQDEYSIPQPTRLRTVLDRIERHPRYSELKNFSCSSNVIPKHSHVYEWQ